MATKQAKKQKVWLHVGMPGVGDVVESAVAHHHAALVELGVASIARTPAEGFRAALEITRSHKRWGLKRGDVEGQWVKIVRRARRGKDDLVFSQTLLAEATLDQIALLVDALAGCQVHVVVTTGREASETHTDAVQRWTSACRKPERMHVIETDGLTSEEVWRAFGRLVGFGTASLRLDEVPSASAGVHSLADAQRELERLARRNASLEVRLEELDRKRRRLRRKLDSVA